MQGALKKKSTEWFNAYVFAKSLKLEPSKKKKVQNGSTRMYLHSDVMCCTNRETRATKKDQDVELAKQFQLLHSPSRLIPKKKKGDRETISAS